MRRDLEERSGEVLYLVLGLDPDGLHGSACFVLLNSGPYVSSWNV